MKTTTSILLLFIILIQTFGSFVYDAAYSLNKNYIAENLCVNKTNPEMHCYGHCFLDKEKQKQESSDKQSNETKQEKFSTSVYELPEEINYASNQISTNIFCNADVNIQLPGYSSSVFHPPLA